MVGIISNIAALTAQFNLNKASSESQASIYRLSSGSKIYKASDDVAGLAVGTILKTNVSTMQAALQNTVQARSLLGVADGALQNVGEILQRQKALAAQATSGSLTDAARSFLNQELQSLKSEIDRISTTTNFNGIKLIDGSLYGPVSVTAKTRSNSTRASADLKIATALTSGKSIFLNGVTITARDTANLASGTAELNIDMTVNSTAAQQASALYNTIQNVLNYQGTDATVLTAKQKLNQMSYSYTSGNAHMTVTSNVAGTVGNGAASSTDFCLGSDMGTATDVTLAGTNCAAVTVSTSVGLGFGASSTVAVNGDLSGGTFSTGTTAYTGTARVIAQGSVTDSILSALTTTVQATTGVDASQVSNNKDFVGNIIAKGSKFEASYVASNLVNLNIKVGDYTYQARNVVTNPAANTIVTLNSIESGGGSFSIQLASGNGVSNIVDQSTAEVFATRLNSALSGVDFYQKRDVSSYVAAGTVYAVGGTTSIGDLQGSSFQLITNDFSKVRIADVQVTAPVLGATSPTIQFITDTGEIYQSGYDQNGSVSALNSTLAAGTFGFVSTTNPKNMFVFTYTSSTNLDLSNAANAAGAKQAFLKAFGVNNGASNLSFQVGTTSADNISVQVQSTKANDIFLDSNGVTVTIDISTQGKASASSPYIDNAINSVTSIRANIGALQSRFNYAASNINTAIQNQDAARGTFLDTDISAESTDFAQSQVRVQASISVLAQANQLTQSLLKLIG
jgi:flagellin